MIAFIKDDRFYFFCGEQGFWAFVGGNIFGYMIWRFDIALIFFYNGNIRNFLERGVNSKF